MAIARQLILFGSPGVGKSHLIQHELLPELEIDPNSSLQCVKAVFHPEYTYGDFMGKLLPLSKDGKVEYRYYEGHFLLALARAYRAVLDNPAEPKRVALVIDELNRGNSSAIFGTVFQLLDRDSNGRSSYVINVSKMEFDTLAHLVGIDRFIGERKKTATYRFNEKEYTDLNEILSPIGIEENQIRIPPNLYIMATINTSDTSIYYMDAAFKRRWDWEFVDVDSSRYSSTEIVLATRAEWTTFVTKLNQFIRTHSSSVRNLDDKQIGYWFITEEAITMAHIQNKLMFFLWDSVFTRDKKPIADLLKLKPDQVISFGDFCRRASEFVTAVNSL